MRPRDGAELLGLAALWGASFLFMKQGATDFGPAALVFLRVAGAAVLLLPLAAQRGAAPALRAHWRPIAVVGLLNSAIPFALYMVAALALNAGLMAIFNATTPLWGALVAWAWLGERPGAARSAGLAIGFAGVALLAGGSASFRPGVHGVSPALAVGACLLATLAYGFAANYTRRRLAGVPALAVAAGSQTAAAVVAAPFALVFWPAVNPGAGAWAAAAVLAFACTGFAYLLYFRLIVNVGAANATAVTFLIPAFGLAWGALFLGERPTAPMAAGCAVILAGTALATGLLPRPRRTARP